MKNYIVDENNRKKSVIIPIKEYEALIEKLGKEKKYNNSIEDSDFKKAFGAFESEKSADEIIDELRKSRKVNRKIEQF